MIVHFIEACQPVTHENWGKFMLCRYSAEEADTNTALPGYEDKPLWTTGGLRAMRPDMTLVVDLQTGEGASFTLVAPPGMAKEIADDAVAKHKIWRCPMYDPFLAWLYAQGLDERVPEDILKLPRFVEIEAEFALVGPNARR